MLSNSFLLLTIYANMLNAHKMFLIYAFFYYYLFIFKVSLTK